MKQITYSDLPNFLQSSISIMKIMEKEFFVIDERSKDYDPKQDLTEYQQVGIDNYLTYWIKKVDVTDLLKKEEEGQDE